jgi:hypothetical protein
VERFSAWIASPRSAWVALGLVAALAILTTSLAWDWVGKRFPGFLVTPDWVVSHPIPGTWSGAEAGLAPGMTIVKVDGEPIGETPSQFIARLRTDPAAFLHRIEARPPERARVEMVSSSVHLVESREFLSRDFGLAFRIVYAAWGFLAAAALILVLEPSRAFRTLFAPNAPRALAAAWFSGALALVGLALTLENLAVDVPGLLPAAIGAALLAAWGLFRALFFKRSMAEWHLADKLAFAAIAVYTALAMAPDITAAWAGSR